MRKRARTQQQQQQIYAEALIRKHGAGNMNHQITFFLLYSVIARLDIGIKWWEYYLQRLCPILFLLSKYLIYIFCIIFIIMYLFS